MSLDNVILKATELASGVDEETNFEATTRRQPVRNKAKTFLYEESDQTLQD